MALGNIAPGKFALIFFLITLAAFGYWLVISVVGPGEHGEHWTAWDNSIDIAWKIIPASLLLSVVSAIVAVAVPKRAGEKSRVRGATVLILAVLFAVYIVLMLTNLHIS